MASIATTGMGRRVIRQGTYMLRAVISTERAVMSKSSVTKATLDIKLIKTVLVNTERMRGQGTSKQAPRKGIRRTEMLRNKTIQRKNSRKRRKWVTNHQQQKTPHDPER